MVEILNTGGTFNKRYDPIEGELYVPQDNHAVERIVEKIPSFGGRIKGMIYKDSLQMNDRDRSMLAERIVQSRAFHIVVVHGTDTMVKSAAVVAERLGDDHNKRVVFTGAMVPFSIDRIEATANLSSALTSLPFLQAGVYVAMHGFVLDWRRIRKNRARGRFERIEI